MSAPRRRLADTSIEQDGLAGIALRGRVVELTVVPDAGGKILAFTHRPSGLALLWQNPRVPLQRTYAGAPFDDVWSGGWDEIFPTDAPCQLDGVSYHDHGDLWIGPWEWELQRDDGRSAVLSMRRPSPSLPCLMERWITLERDSPEVAVRYRLTNLGTQPVRFLWNVHVAQPVTPGARLHLPASRLAVQAPYTGRAEGAQGGIPWPLFRGRDLSRLPPPTSGLTEFLCTDDLREGWCAVSHRQAGVALVLRFDRSVFPQVWAFGAYGGWRGHHVLVVEPSTGRPGSLADNVAAGAAAVLEPAASLETEVLATAVSPVDPEAPGYALPG